MTENETVIRFAVHDDVNRLMEAIKNHWDVGHILANNKDFFMYLFGGDDTQINMVIGEDRDTKEIMGFLGFIKYGSSNCCDVSPIVWKTVHRRDAYLGVELLQFLVKKTKPELFFGIGINPDTTIPIYRALKYHVGMLDHYYRIADKDLYKIAVITDKRILPIIDFGWDIVPIVNFNDFYTKIDVSLFDNVYPHKDFDYWRHRYFAHPLYRYVIYAVTKNDVQTIPAFLVCREIKKNGANILRIIDYIGKESYFAQLAFPLQKLMDEKDYEYIDCYCCGLSEEVINSAGLIRRTPTDQNVIPNYFEPFLCKNADIYYFTNKSENFRSFKGDADQDQPRLSDRSLC